MSSADAQLVKEVVARHGGHRHGLLQMLCDVQARLHHVPAGVAAELGRVLGLPATEVEAVRSFYSFLSARPLGEYVIHFSDNVIDRMGGSVALLERLCRHLEVRPGEPRGDGRVTVATTSCTGMADQGPAALVNGLALTRLDAARVDAIADLVERRVPVAKWPASWFVVDDQVRRAGALLADPPAPGAALAAALARGADATLAELAAADLRGCGGAGFRTARKWAGARAAALPPGGERFVLCNADEGEPGTFKDRVLLSRQAGAVLEGMTLCALVIGARRGVLYVRHEYRYLEAALQAVLAERRAAGLLGDAILGSALGFDVELHWGAGAYICGMETAMIESIAGKRGVPRHRAPLPVVHGYQGGPTVVNNVETFALASLISARGATAFSALGTPESRGSKLLCVSGDCERPGIYEHAYGLTVQELLDECGAGATQAIQVGGPSGTLIGPAEFARRLCWEDLPTVGTMMIFGAERDLFDQVRGFAEFFQHESCGLCTPCRVGTTMLRRLCDKVAHGAAAPADLVDARRLGGLMKLASHCGLGQTAANPVLDAIQKFPHIFTSRMHAGADAGAGAEAGPSFDLDGALAEARALTGRDDPEAHLR